MSSSEIIPGMQEALKYAQCPKDHKDSVVVEFREMEDGRTRVMARCDECDGVTTKFLPPGAVEFVKVERRVVCPRCDGNGFTHGGVCDECGGLRELEV